MFEELEKIDTHLGLLEFYMASDLWTDGALSISAREGSCEITDKKRKNYESI
jgi:hypothetical protein